MKSCNTILIIIIVIISALFAQDQTFKLQDGTIIVGSVQEETETTYIIQTKYGGTLVYGDTDSCYICFEKYKTSYICFH